MKFAPASVFAKRRQIGIVVERRQAPESCGDRSLEHSVRAFGNTESCIDLRNVEQPLTIIESEGIKVLQCRDCFVRISFERGPQARRKTSQQRERREPFLFATGGAYRLVFAAHCTEKARLEGIAAAMNVLQSSVIFALHVIGVKNTGRHRRIEANGLMMGSDRLFQQSAVSQRMDKCG